MICPIQPEHHQFHSGTFPAQTTALESVSLPCQLLLQTAPSQKGSELEAAPP